MLCAGDVLNTESSGRCVCCYSIIRYALRLQVLYALLGLL